MASRSRNSEPVRRKQPAQPAPRLIDDRARRDILGIVFLLLGVLALLAVIIPTDAVVTAGFNQAVRLTFGIGAYITPFFLIAIGLTFLIKFERQRMSARVAIGLALILVAIIGMIGLSTPIVGNDYDQLFYELALINHGGYIGASIAWSGLSLFGFAITVAILIGVIIIGIIVIGFSISELIERGRAFARAHRGEGFRLRRSQSLDEPQGARVRKGDATRRKKPASHPSSSLEKADSALLSTDAAAQTALLSDDKAKTALLAVNKDADAVANSDETADHASSSSGLSSAKTALLESLDEPTPTAASIDAPLFESEDDAVGLFTPEVIRPDSSAPFEPDPADDGFKVPEDAPKKATRKAPAAKSSSKASSPTAPTERILLPDAIEEEGYTLPPMNLLSTSKGQKVKTSSEAELSETAARLQATLADFGIGSQGVNAQVRGWVTGPTVTLFKVELPAGVRVSRVVSLSDDIALALAAPGVRVFAPIPGTNYVGIEVPNKHRQMVYLGDVLPAAEDGLLQIAIGKNVEGESIVSNLASMPHLLIGGTTGSGKSFAIHSMIMSILMRATPDEVRFIMIDPKRVEFIHYEDVPHLYVPVVTEPKEASSALAWSVAEMERRLKLMSKAGARNITEYNDLIKSGKLEDAEELCYIVIIIDELADLMMNARKEVEHYISRIAQLARAAGIHLIIATQRPSSDVVTGLIKANITCRIALTVATGIDSRVILDTSGAESLISKGDMLFSKPEYAKPQRIQGCFVPNEDIDAVTSFLKAQGEPEYHNEILKTNTMSLGDTAPDGGTSTGDEDPLLWEAAEIVVASSLGSISNIQRRLKVGHSRAGRIMDQLEEKGVVGPASGAKARDVLVDELELETLKAFEASDSGANPLGDEG